MKSDDISIVEAITKLAVKGSNLTSLDVVPDLNGLQSGMRRWVGVPEGVSVTDVTTALVAGLPNPLARKGTIHLSALTSFESFLGRMQQPQTVLFADQKKSTLTAIFDFHDPINVGDTKDETAAAGVPSPQWGRFRAVYSFPQSRQWQAWMAKHKQQMSQADLASHIEENILDVQHPGDLVDGALKGLVHQLGMKLAPQATLLNVARSMQLNASEDIRQAVNTSTGETIISYTQAHNPTDGSGGEMAVPNAFLICIPVFEGGERYQQLTRLRYTKNGAKVSWTYDIYALARAMEDAFTTACDEVALNTETPLFYGEPPAVSA